MSLAVPLTTPTFRRPSAYWWTSECSDARRKKARALSVYKNHKFSIPLWIAFKKAQALFCRTCKDAQRLNALAGTPLYPSSLPTPLQQWSGTEYENCEAAPEHDHSFLLTILALLLSPPMCPRLSHRILQNAAMAPQLMLSLRPIGHAASYV